MKKLVLILTMVFITVVVNAQEKGDMSAGLRLNLGTSPHSGMGSQMGLGLDFNYSITDAIRLAPEFNFFFPKKELGVKWNTWDFSINGQYLFKLGNSKKFVVYPQFGLTLQGASVKLDYAGFGDAKTSETKFGINFGAGAEYMISDALSADFRVKYNIVSNWSRAVIGIGIAYRF